MKFNFGSLKRTAASVFTTAALVVVFAGAGVEAFAQKPYKQQQKAERRDLRREQRYERRTYGTSRSLRREHKAERRELKADQKAEKRYYKQTRRNGYYTNNGRRAYRTKRPFWARARNR
ncbi:MAG TPA: hypothetical protein VGW12_13580 [Pyrinomonadaceae bacterium]|nr:hypothetical protein [Pyrinomonadaceae bacterium]